MEFRRFLPPRLLFWILIFLVAVGWYFRYKPVGADGALVWDRLWDRLCLAEPGKPVDCNFGE